MVFYASRYLNNDTGSANKPEFQTTSYCNIIKGCQSRVGEGLVSLNILPSTMPTGQPLDITVELSGLIAEKVTMEFVGRNMPMGLMPFSLKKQSGQSSGPERYTGTGSITFCTADTKMVWVARAKIETREAIHRVLFELDTLETDKQ
ncbi:hypothetical protein [Endozoicomonas sp.]|uniref:hypothetical protein n=1 Tax=Endozoicomonas sp. TaxID=1892382 RepID=UPI002884F87B|nr:hypothetical protein [Endozoicomonas sp.]